MNDYLAETLTSLERLLPRPLLGRSILIIVTPIVLLQVVSAWVFYDSHWDTVTRRLAQAVGGLRELREVVEAYGDGRVGVAVASVDNRQGASNQRLGGAVVRLRQQEQSGLI